MDDTWPIIFAVIAMGIVGGCQGYNAGHQVGYRQGQIDCIEGRIKFIPTNEVTYKPKGPESEEVKGEK